jgi:hypothetical protein
MLQQVQQETGLIGTVIFGGPDLMKGGNIISFS